jgi:hypothetical protein
MIASVPTISSGVSFAFLPCFLIFFSAVRPLSAVRSTAARTGSPKAASTSSTAAPSIARGRALGRLR